MRRSFSRMRHRDRRRAGLLLFAGSIGFAIGMTLAEATFPGYNVGHDFLGDLAPRSRCDRAGLGLVHSALGYDGGRIPPDAVLDLPQGGGPGRLSQRVVNLV